MKKTASIMLFTSLLSSSLILQAAQPTLPLLANGGTIQVSPSVSGWADVFRGIDLEESHDFDGYTVGFEVVYPFSKRTQLRVDIPVYTKGEAKLQAENLFDVDIEGHTGVYDFASIGVEHQLWNQENDGMNLMVLAAYAQVLDPLEVVLTGDLAERLGRDGERTDRYNHKGMKITAGVGMDKSVSGNSHVLADVKLHYYLDTDDLSLSGEEDFFMLETNVGWVYRVSDLLVPAVEVQAKSDFDGYTSVKLVPELMLNFGENVSLRNGVMLGVTDDAGDTGFRTELLVNF